MSTIYHVIPVCSYTNSAHALCVHVNSSIQERPPGVQLLLLSMKLNTEGKSPAVGGRKAKRPVRPAPVCELQFWVGTMGSFLSLRGGEECSLNCQGTEEWGGKALEETQHSMERLLGDGPLSNGVSSHSTTGWDRTGTSYHRFSCFLKNSRQ
jgi:hypothetical protein